MTETKIQYGLIGGSLGMAWIDANEKTDRFLKMASDFRNTTVDEIISILKTGAEIKIEAGFDATKIRDANSIRPVSTEILPEPDYCSNNY